MKECGQRCCSRAAEGDKHSWLCRVVAWRSRQQISVGDKSDLGWGGAEKENPAAVASARLQLAASPACLPMHVLLSHTMGIWSHLSHLSTDCTPRNTPLGDTSLALHIFAGLSGGILAPLPSRAQESCYGHVQFRCLGLAITWYLMKLLG